MKKICNLLIISLLLISCQKNNEKIRTIVGEAQGTTYGIKYISASDKNLKPAIDSIIEVIDLSMSTYRDESIISAINEGKNAKIDAHFEKVFLASERIWKESEGLFDPTIGVLVNAWGFGKNKSETKLTDNQVDSLKQFVGFDKVSLSKEGFITKKNPFIRFDFNAIAQGYTSDVIANYLKINHIENFIVEVGGEIFISGKNTIDDKNWTIGIENPLENPENSERNIIKKVQFQGEGLATSGNYRKVWTDPKTGEKFVHSINPKTGKAQQSNLLSVTVIAPSAMLADGYATMFMVMGLEKSKEFVKNRTDLAVFFIFNNAENKMDFFMNDRFLKIVTE